MSDLLDVTYSYSKWNDWLSSCAEYLDCKRIALVRWKPENKDGHINHFTSGTPPEIEPEWLTWFDELMTFFIPEGPMLLEDIVAKLEATREYDCKYDIDTLINQAPLHGTLKIGLVWWQNSYGFLILKRDENHPWTASDDTILRLLLEGLHRAFKLSTHIYEQRLGNAVSAAVLNSSPRGLAILEPDGRVGFCTSKARAILDINDGIGLRQGVLYLHDEQQQQDLQEAMQDLINKGSGTFNMAIPRPSGKMPFQFMLLAMKTKTISPAYLHNVTFFSFYLHDPTSTYQLALEQLQRYFGFTQAEAKVARSLFKNDSLASVSEELGISINTTRTHLRRIYRKANVNSQSELMRALSGGLRAELVTKDEIKPDLSMFTVENTGPGWKN